MIAKDTLGYTVRAKSGWGSQDNKEIGWYVGYFEKMIKFIISLIVSKQLI